MKKSRELAADLRTKTLHWDAADYLDEPEDVFAYLRAAIEDGDSRVIMAALGDIARSCAIARIAILTLTGADACLPAKFSRCSAITPHYSREELRASTSHW